MHIPHDGRDTCALKSSKHDGGAKQKEKEKKIDPSFFGSLLFLAPAINIEIKGQTGEGKRVNCCPLSKPRERAS